MLLKHLRAQPPAPRIRDRKIVDQLYEHWRLRILAGTFFGYAAYYLCRKNISIASPVMQEEGFTKDEIGFILAGTSIAYGVSRVFLGVLADRANPRYFMAIGLLLSAVANLLFGLSTAAWLLFAIWLLNGVFQAMGAAPCVRSMTQWYADRERGTWWGIWNASHQVGGATILIGGAWLAEHYGWRTAFTLPAAICVLFAVFIVITLRDNPQSLGLPPIDRWRDPANIAAPVSGDIELTAPESWRSQLWDHVLKNPALWVLALANFFVYVVRYGAMDWAPTLLVEMKGFRLGWAGVVTAGFEVAGVFGAIVAGWLSDRFFDSRRGPVCAIFMVLLGAAVFALWRIPAGSPWLDAAALIAIGFLVYGPQMLIGVGAADVCSREAAATGNGFTGLFGYIGGAVAGAGTGLAVKHYGWDGGFVLYLASCVMGAILCAFLWNMRRRAS